VGRRWTWQIAKSTRHEVTSQMSPVSHLIARVGQPQTFRKMKHARSQPCLITDTAVRRWQNPEQSAWRLFSYLASSRGALISPAKAEYLASSQAPSTRWHRRPRRGPACVMLAPPDGRARFHSSISERDRA
jgi:hypothetical protein